MSNNSPANLIDHIEVASRVIKTETEAISILVELLDESFSEAVETILRSKGRVVVAGIGKSGLVGRKISATLASVGTPSFFIHPTEAFHGDLGMILPEDIFLGISNSGETRELIELLPYLKQNGNQILSISGNPQSTLAENSNWHLNIGRCVEACAMNVVPTSSTTATLVLGDALAIALMEARNFTERDFVRYHPNGSLGRRLSSVGSVMKTDNLPWVESTDSVVKVLREISARGIGIALVRHEHGTGLITDGDIRRGMEKFGKGFFDLVAKDIMTSDPKQIGPSSMMGDAIDMMDRLQVSSLLVKDGPRVLGVVTNQPLS